MARAKNVGIYVCAKMCYIYPIVHAFARVATLRYASQLIQIIFIHTGSAIFSQVIEDSNDGSDLSGRNFYSVQFYIFYHSLTLQQVHDYKCLYIVYRDL